MPKIACFTNKVVMLTEYSVGAQGDPRPADGDIFADYGVVSLHCL
jgi:hypothetical protein